MAKKTKDPMGEETVYRNSKGKMVKEDTKEGQYLKRKNAERTRLEKKKVSLKDRDRKDPTSYEYVKPKKEKQGPGYKKGGKVTRKKK